MQAIHGSCKTLFSFPHKLHVHQPKLIFFLCLSTQSLETLADCAVLQTKHLDGIGWPIISCRRSLERVEPEGIFRSCFRGCFRSSEEVQMKLRRKLEES